MKKIIPILGIGIGALILQRCAERNDNIQDLTDSSVQKLNDQSVRKDSTRSTQEIVDPDPPVRDGDNWRIVSK
ncbi:MULTISPECIES: hypothetical protein [Chryseobacterium]|uniref:hypothetical protein n=1 Tax=Chryseobacterium TaxID=59732 RepID=UPI0011082545|nr:MULTISPECIES: hypothetical protein [Chryseobacterium]MBF6643926.1 hypothetical protein [Chryseobacterium indologenes]MBU3046791.1 hypothetical protein [Chryseobacterium indologenes]QQQ72346.1 hypothetical protein JHW31_06380 [Chryseobacterium indologenes]TLX26574.1 hypothetical protein FE904_06900 [Chryseobacterium indologenes]WET50752.1 hypothetical protein PYS58_06365 [Chryseobacterium indologenes]